MQSSTIRLGVNIDHVATLRQARGTLYPDPVQAALQAVQAGADGITLHLREDRRHIQERDVQLLKPLLAVPMNLEMAATEAMLSLAETLRPEHCCIVPERREELTTEGGLDVVKGEQALTVACQRLAAVDVEVSLFIEPDSVQIEAAKRCGAPVIELHTGHYADAQHAKEQAAHLQRMVTAAKFADDLGLIVNAGHGLNRHNVQAIAAIPYIQELNIGHSIIAEAVFIGLTTAIKELKAMMLAARHC